MKITLTGTGTSQGIPVIGCGCEVCTSDDWKDKRLRTAAFIQDGNTNIAIDAGPDFRQQMLAVGADHLDALILTHEHNDHIAGLDDIRPFNFLQRKPIKVFSLARVANDLRSRFAYIFSPTPYPGAPSIDLIEILPQQRLQVGPVEILPFSVFHGAMEILSFRVGAMAYITDANRIPPASENALVGVETLIINALHHRVHHSHFNLQQAIEQVEMRKIPRALFTHISHQMGRHQQVNAELPEGMELGYDGLTITI